MYAWERILEKMKYSFSSDFRLKSHLRGIMLERCVLNFHFGFCHRVKNSFILKLIGLLPAQNMVQLESDCEHEYIDS